MASNIVQKQTEQKEKKHLFLFLIGMQHALISYRDNTKIANI